MEERREDRIGYVNMMQGWGASKQKVDKVGIRVKLFAVLESGERKRNLTTLVLVKKNRSETKPVPTKVLESSQNRLKWSCIDSTEKPCSTPQSEPHGD